MASRIALIWQREALTSAPAVSVPALSAPAVSVPALSVPALSAPASSVPPTPALTWAELDAQVDTYARALLALQLPAGETSSARVAIALPNCVEFVALYFGILRAGLVAVPINPGYTGRELRELLADSAASVLIATGDVWAALADDSGTVGGAVGGSVGGSLGGSVGGEVAGGAAYTEHPHHRYRLDRPATATAPDGGQISAEPISAEPISAEPVDAEPLEALFALGLRDGAANAGQQDPLQDPDRTGTDGEARSGGEDLAVLLYTSGTEGRPKGAMLSHRALLANHVQVAGITPPPIGRDDVALLAVPLFHAYGLNSGLGAVAFHGATGVLVESFDPADSLRLIETHGVTAIVGVPTMFLAWSRLAGFRVAPSGGPMRSVRVAVCGAAPLDAGTARRYAEATGHPIFVGYGLTETAPVLTTTLASLGGARLGPKIGSIGRAIPGVEIKLISASGEQVWRSANFAAHSVASSAADFTADFAVDFDDDSAGSPGSDPGEIVARGANLFSGYWPDGRDAPDADGWWATGDVAYADGDGDLFLVDRLRELILVNGFNVYPVEVERVLTAHPAVAAAAVVGVPDPYTGQAVKAFVVPSRPGRADAVPGQHAMSEPDSEPESVESVGIGELRRHCERNLARFKCPSAIEFVAELPYSATGKVRKVALR